MDEGDDSDEGTSRGSWGQMNLSAKFLPYNPWRGERIPSKSKDEEEDRSWTGEEHYGRRIRPL